MKINFKFLTLLVMSGFVISCASVVKNREGNLQFIRAGQSMDEVVGILGQPREKKTQAAADGKPAAELWYYDIYSNDSYRIREYRAFFENKALTELAAGIFSARGRSDKKLRKQRALANQFLFIPIPGAGPEGSAPITDSPAESVDLHKNPPPLYLESRETPSQQ